MNQRWYAVQTEPRREIWVGSELRAAGFESFLPLCRQRVTHARSRSRPEKFETRPLFPTYLFTRFDLARDPWRDVTVTRGVIRLICNAERPVAIPVGVIEDLQARTRIAKGALELGPKRWRTGQAVRVTEGPLAGHRGIYSTRLGERMRVLLEMFGQTVPTDLPEAALAAE